MNRLLKSVHVKLQTKAFLGINSFLNKILQSKGMGYSIMTRELESDHRNQPNFDKLDEWCLILHGKIYDESFLRYLVDNLIILRKYNEKLTIIVSTYEDSLFAELKALTSDLNIKFIKVLDVGTLPDPYPKSLAQQIASFSAGLNFAKQRNFKYAVKLRVDQMIDPHSFFNLANTCFRLFPPRNTEFATRIWSTSYNTYKYRTLGISDMFMFGSMDIMSSYWGNISPADIINFNQDTNNEKYKEQLYSFTIPETWLAYRFMSNNDKNSAGISEISQMFWSDYAGIINSQAIKFSWGKSKPWLASNFQSINWFGGIYSRELAELSFEDWLSTY